MSVINTNISSLIGLNNLRLTGLGLRTSLERLSSGVRINYAADDPSGMSIAKGMEAQIGGIRMATQNIEDGINVIHTADGALAETSDILMRMRDLAVRASNEAVLTTADNTRLQNEFRSLKDELQRKSIATTFNTKILFSGGFALSAAGGVGAVLPDGLVLQVGPDNGTVYRLTLKIPELGLVGLGLSMRVAGTGFSTDLNIPTRAMSAINRVQVAIDTVSNARQALGVQERRLLHVIDDLKAEDINISAAKSRIWDADMATEISEFTRLQILQQSGTAILAQANAQPQSVLQLLK